MPRQTDGSRDSQGTTEVLGNEGQVGGQEEQKPQTQENCLQPPPQPECRTRTSWYEVLKARQRKTKRGHTEMLTHT